MDDAWFDNYVYEVFVKKEFVPTELLRKFEESETTYVDPWTVMWAELD